MTRKIKALLVDDEPPAVERLTSLLAAHPVIDVVGHAGDVEAAASLCASLRPDVVFLDIQMPRASGFDLLPRLTGRPAVVFVTAFDRFAIRAFEVNALDYLLKPVHPERLARAIERLQGTSQETCPARLQDSDLILLKEERSTRLVPLQAVSHIKAEENYTSVFLIDAAPAFVRRTLTEWERILPEGRFLRVDRSLILRLDAVQSLHSESRDCTLVQLAGQKQPVALGRRAALNLRRAIQGI